MAVQTSDAASIHLLRRLRAGEDIHFVHRADVCSAAPADLVARLQPVPGTNVTDDDGYSRVWYLFCAKKYKNATGKASGHRQRAIVGGDTCWRAELRAKAVEGCSDGATFCNLSYGRKMNGGSGRSFDRMGWCMVEYDDSKDGGGDHVLCKVYRSSSSLAKGKSKSSSTGSTSSSRSKRKAAAAAVTDQPDARPAKFAHHEQYNTPFTNDYREESMLGDGNRYGVQQHVQQEVAGGFIDTEYGPLNQGGEVIQMKCGLVAPVVNQATVDEMLGPDPETMYGGVMMPTAGTAPDDDFFGEQIEKLQQHGLPHPVQMEEPQPQEHVEFFHEPQVQQQEEELEASAALEQIHDEQEQAQQHATTFNNDDHAFDQQLLDILSQDDLGCLHQMLLGTNFNDDDDDCAAPYYDPRDVQFYLEHMQQEGTFNNDDCTMSFNDQQQPSAGICAFVHGLPL